MKSLRPLSVLLVFLAIAACAPPRAVVQPKPVAPPRPAVATAPLKLAPAPRASLDAARRSLDAGLADVALEQLDALHPEQLDNELRLQWHMQRAAAYSLQGGLLEAVRERAAADRLQTDPAARRRNQEAILEALALLPAEQLGGYPMLAGDPLSGWLALGRILAMPQPEEKQRNFAQWNRDYPGHPAAAGVAQAYLNRQPEPAAAVSPEPATPMAPPAPVAAAPAPPAATPGPNSPGVAVLLPASGASAAFGEAVRQGITSAHASDESRAKPALRFYDTETGDVESLYRKALEEGAQVVIGPLRKEQVAALAEAGDLPKPVLALNRIDATRDGLYQFSLWPEEELEQAADIARQEGRGNALLLVPAKEFGQRMASHFSDYWRSLGGRVVAVQTYLPGEKDFAVTIKKLLRVNEPSKEHPPVPRADADAIFLVAESGDGRLIVPQLRYYGATRLPVYSTSSVYSGRPNRSQDQDLAGVVFCDAPWVLTDDGAGQKPGAPSVGGNGRLLAMGMDAYRMSSRLNKLQYEPFEGASGSLTLTPGNRIHRQLGCAHFEGGMPVRHVPQTPAAAEQAAH